MDAFFTKIDKWLFYKIALPRNLKKLHVCGRNVTIGYGASICDKSKISIGDHVYIGPDATILSTKANVIIKHHVTIGPHVTIVTGDHRTDLIGTYMSDIGNSGKLPENDEDVIIEEDVWIGSNVTILKGVTIGKGSVIGAGSIVVKSVKPYTINAGNPCHALRDRFSPDQIVEHEKLLEKMIDR